MRIRWSIFVARASISGHLFARGSVRVASCVSVHCGQLFQEEARISLPLPNICLDLLSVSSRNSHSCEVGGAWFRDYPPVLFVVTFSLAISSCFAIWFSRCRSRFCSISSCCRKSRMAFLGASFLFCPDCPPNQAPHILSIVLGSRTPAGQYSTALHSQLFVFVHTEYG